MVGARIRKSPMGQGDKISFQTNLKRNLSNSFYIFLLNVNFGNIII